MPKGTRRRVRIPAPERLRAGVRYGSWRMRRRAWGSMSNVRINLEIPRTMTVHGLEFLGRLAATVPENGKIVELGPLYGSSSWVLAKNSRESVKVYSIDPWESSEWICRRFGKDVLPFSIHAFKEYTADTKNVVPIQGFSPDCVKNWWHDKIDMYFDDSAHGKTPFVENLTFWEPLVWPGGILCGDDYATGWLGLVDAVVELAENWGTTPEVIGRVWAVRKPLPGEKISPSLGNLLPPMEAPQLILSAKNVGREWHTPIAQGWAGRLWLSEPLEALSVAWEEETPYLDVQMYVGSEGRGAWYDVNQVARPPEPPVTELGFRLKGECASKYTISYQGGIGRPWYSNTGGKLNTGAFKNGQIITVDYPLTAVRVVLTANRDAGIRP